ncbi:Flagellar biosynthetic protein FliQ [Poriferisphaera corsica]|uniref:Flagellar biosynthetic protein FliQ n=1 Tax=Poriferisphaera corsica TaxID=2528020 RepID=A0A517YSG6_9BACT|nr:flagellar biosynthesis protein FliQ [Poriferisphaera corsica]QDU33183.1 Flagellar biosynthetic protein FliQ [Poriferisphaera corsica]
MTEAQAIEFVRETLTLMLLLSLPVLAAALIVGLTISIFQAVTQIQEQTLSFVPKILGMGIVAILAMPWVVSKILEFANRMFSGF